MINLEPFYRHLESMTDEEYDNFLTRVGVRREKSKRSGQWVRIPNRNVAKGLVQELVVNYLIKQMQSRSVSWEVYQSVFGDGDK